MSETKIAKLTLKRENKWNNLSAADKKAMTKYTKDYLHFLSSAKTEREAHDMAVEMALQVGYHDLETLSQDPATLKPGNCIFRSCRGKTILLAKIGKRPISEGVHIVGGHTDAPRLDSKPSPLYEDGKIALLDTHYYGGIRKYQWVSLPLAIHGVVIREDGSKVNINIGEKDSDPVFVINDLLPHLGKDQMKKTLGEAITGENLNIIMGTVPAEKTKDNKEYAEKVKLNILNILNEKYDITEEDLVSAELEIVPAGKARECGLDRSMLLGYAHDDRICSYAALKALIDSTEVPEYTSVVLMCDKEEIGSVGATGMDSLFFENTMAEIIARIEPAYNDLTLRRCLENSRMLSADVNVLHDPNYPEVSSPNNAAQINSGIVLGKYTGSRGKAGSSEAMAEFVALIRKMFNENTVFWQTGELGKVDMGGGGTISMFMARYGMDVLDCGPGLLSMHGPWETAGKLDTYMAYKGYKTFFEYEPK